MTAHKLTTQQCQALFQIQHFLRGPAHCFILRGGAGTGKTTLLAELAKVLTSERRLYQFLAPTGRAARILGDKTGADAATIHGCIYAFDDLQVFEQAQTANDPGLRYSFTLKTDDPGNRVFIIDEASMVGDLDSQQDMLRFGSGRLLADLIAYSRVGRAARPGSHRDAKLIFIGDPAQLPPVGQTQSPALSADYLREQFQLRCEQFELTEVHRQQTGSAILEQAVKLREAILRRDFNSFNLQPHGDDLQICSVQQAVERIADAYQGGQGSAVMVTHSNAKAWELNRAVRERLWSTDCAELRNSDHLLITHNSRLHQLFNGDLVKVLGVSSGSERRTVRMRGAEPVDLLFRPARIVHRNATGTTRVHDCLLIENHLNSKERGLSPLEQRALLVDFRQRHPGLRPKSAQFALALMQDPWFNALQVKYGYAMTAHKAQGGEWDTGIVFFEPGQGTTNENFFRWSYTAITRAKRQLFTISAPSFNAYSSMRWSQPSSPPAPTLPDSPAPANARAPTSDPDWTDLGFDQQAPGLFEHHRRLRDALAGKGIAITEVSHLQYCERYHMRGKGADTLVQYWYKKDARVSKVETVGHPMATDPNLTQAALGIFETVLFGNGAETHGEHSQFTSELLDRLQQGLMEHDIRILSTRALNNCLRIELADHQRRGAIDFYYNDKKRWTHVQEVGGPGKSQGLYEQICPLLAPQS